MLRALKCSLFSYKEAISHRAMDKTRFDWSPKSLSGEQEPCVVRGTATAMRLAMPACIR